MRDLFINVSKLSA